MYFIAFTFTCNSLYQPWLLITGFSQKALEIIIDLILKGIEQIEQTFPHQFFITKKTLNWRWIMDAKYKWNDLNLRDELQLLT